MIGAIKPWNGTGYALLLSAGNNVVSSPDKRAAGKPYAGQIAGHDVTRVNDPLLKEDVFITWQDIAVGNSQTPWKLAIITPVSEVMAEARAFLLKAIIMMVLSIVAVSLVMAQIFTRKVDRPVGANLLRPPGSPWPLPGGSEQHHPGAFRRYPQHFLRPAHHADAAQAHRRQHQRSQPLRARRHQRNFGGQP
jgi:hypothetical protein